MPLPPKQLCRESPVASKSPTHGSNHGKSFFDEVSSLLPDETMVLAYQGQKVSRLIFPLFVSPPMFRRPVLPGWFWQAHRLSPSGLPVFQMAGDSPWRATFARPWAIAGSFWDAAI